MVTGFFDVKYVRRSETLRRNRNKLPEFPMNPMAFLIKHSSDVAPEDPASEVNPNRFKIIFVSLHYLFMRSR